MESIPAVVLPLTGHIDPETVVTIGTAFEDIGFVFVKAPGIAEMLPPIYAEFKKVFDLPEEVKRSYARPDLHYQRGYTPLLTEEAVFCRKKDPNGTDIGDMKENWFIGPEISPDHYIVKQFPTFYPPNIWPAEVPDLRIAMQILYAALLVYGHATLRAVAHYLEKPDSYFDEMLRDAPTVMRALNYPPFTLEHIAEKRVWGCGHTDINFVTVLPRSSRSGLWIKRHYDDVWIPGAAPEGYVIVQVGDMLQYLTAGKFHSAFHEVRAPEKPTAEGRLSAALFMHARSDVLFNPDVKNGYPPILAGTLLGERLAAINLGKGKQTKIY